MAFGIPVPTSRFVTPDGMIDRQWYLFLNSLFGVTGGTTSGTVNQVLHGASGGYSAVATGDIAANAVTNSKFRQSVGLSVIGVTGTAGANVADITGTTDQVLRVNVAGTALAFGSVNLSSVNAVNGVLQTGNGGTGTTTSTGTGQLTFATNPRLTAPTFTVSAAIISDRGLTFTNQTDAQALNTATLTNAPVAGNPTFWLKVSINGNNFTWPCWPA
jgi:hypothetical protein